MLQKLLCSRAFRHKAVSKLCDQAGSNVDKKSLSSSNEGWLGWDDGLGVRPLYLRTNMFLPTVCTVTDA